MEKISWKKLGCSLLLLTSTAVLAQVPGSEKAGGAESGTGFSIEGNVGFVTNYLSSGETMTNDRPSLYGNIRGTYDWFFAEVTMNTVQEDFFKKFQVEWIPAVGATVSVGDVNLYGTYRFYRYTGGTWWDDEKLSSYNYDELAVGGDWNGFYGELAYAIRPDDGDSRDLWLQLGYSYDIDKVNIDGSFFFTHYDEASATRFTSFQIQASYNFDNGIQPYVGVAIGGQDADNERIPTRVFAGIQYNF